MIQKSTVEQYLHANGVRTDAPDEEIKSVLFSAKWHEEDVETALMVLKENTETHEQRIDSLHKVFHTDDRLQPETISALLGIDVDIAPASDLKKKTKSGFGIVESLTVLIIALCFAGLMFVGAMWHLKIGLFYPTL